MIMKIMIITIKRIITMITTTIMKIAIIITTMIMNFLLSVWSHDNDSFFSYLFNSKKYINEMTR